MCDVCHHGLQQLLDNDPREEMEAQIQAYPDISDYLQRLYNEVSNIIRMTVQRDSERIDEEYLHNRQQQITNILERRDRAITNYKNGEPIQDESAMAKMRFDSGSVGRYKFPAVNYEESEGYTEDDEEFDEAAIPHPDEQPQEVQASNPEG